MRGRVMLLCLLLLVLGSPWVQEHVLDLYVAQYGNHTVRWLVEGAFVPGWAVSPDEYSSTSVVVVNDLSVLVLVVALASATTRLANRGAPGRFACLVVGVLVSELVALLQWGLFEVFVDEADLSLGGLRNHLLHAPLAFGLVTGVLLALLVAGPPRAGGSGFTGPRRAGSAGAAKAPLRRRKGETGMAASQVHTPVGSAPGDVTRYLCAAAHVDERFADRVVEDVLADETGAVAPSPDVDLVAVARHCLAARELRHRRDLRLAGAFGVVAVLAPLWLVFTAVLLPLVTAADRSRPGPATRGRLQPGGGVLVNAGVRAGAAALGALLLGTTVASLPVSGFPGWLLGAYLAGVPAALASAGAMLFAYVTVARHELDTDRLLRTTMTREAFARQSPPSLPRGEWLAGRLADVERARDGNVTVYSGFSPFIGYAETVSNWSIAVPLLPADDPVDAGARPGEPEAFTVVELVGHLRARLRAIAARGDAEGTADADPEALGSLVVEDRIFANGTIVGGDSRFTAPDGLAPAARLSPETVEEIMLRPTGAVRHCLAVHVPLWGGDVVPSVFLHFAAAGRTLHLHCDVHVLGPVDAAYHVVDHLSDPLTPERRRGLLVTALSRTGPAFLRAPSRALRHARFEARHTRRMVDELTAMEQDPLFDQGARLSVREMALSPGYHNYFQVVDAGRITSAVERHTLAAIRAFLDARGYDTTDFRSQQQTILNQGLIQQGGMSIIGNQAIGAGASATQHVTQQPGPAAAGAAGGSGR
ncbi:hypothetical protein ACIBAI_27035 [Streptomyces sp. NPDC051041]|uniref:hypothetical protein n=1 Tax=Streptomyces sp. NPDC051041 TaxID=3365640 RepID=UPI0037BA81BF